MYFIIQYRFSIYYTLNQTISLVCSKSDEQCGAVVDERK